MRLGAQKMRVSSNSSVPLLPPQRHLKCMVSADIDPARYIRIHY